MKTLFPLHILVAMWLAIPVHAKAAPQNPTAPALQKSDRQTTAPPSGGSNPLVKANDSPAGKKADPAANTTGEANPATSTLFKVLSLSALSALATLIGVTVTIVLYFKVKGLNTQWADRTVKIEAQKLLLEVNKQYAANPDLWAVYDANFDKLPMERQTDRKLQDALRAVAFMKLNIFEIVFSVHPSGPEQTAWKGFFKDSLEQCTLVRRMLNDYKNLYNPNLLKIYEEFKKGLPAEKQYPSPVEVPAPSGSHGQFDEKTVRKLRILAEALADPGDTQ